MKTLLLITTIFTLISCNKEEAAKAAKSGASEEKSSEASFTKEKQVVAEAELQDGEYWSTCKEISTEESERYEMYVDNDEIYVRYHNFWTYDCEEGSHNEFVTVLFERESQDYIKTTYYSRHDSWYDKCEMGGYAGQHVLIDNIDCSMSWENKRNKFTENGESGYSINGIDFVAVD